MYKGFFLPKEITNRVIKVISNAVEEKKLNIGLFFDKYILWWKEDRELKCNPQMQISFLRKVMGEREKSIASLESLLANQDIQDRKFREEMSKNVRFNIPLIFFPKGKEKEYWRIYVEKMSKLFNTLGRMGYYIKYLPDERSGLSLSWRLIINIGAASVYETSLLFHRNYSIPYIPGSAVKGVTRYWAIQKFAEKSKKDPKSIDDALSEGEDLRISVDNVSFTDLVKIFGHQNQKGEVIFFDALPIIDQESESKRIIVLDVMNVHYRLYYEEGKTPGDWHNPTLIFFLAVEKDVKFRFALASKNKELVVKAKSLLEEALRNVGIGAKTSAGYGYFE